MIAPIGVLVCLLSAPATAGIIQLGIQNFTDGQLIGSVGTWEAGSVGDSEPFLTFQGSDFGDPASATWTFNFAPILLEAANFTIGIWDHDSAAPGNQVASFTVDGFDLTALLNAAFNAHGGRQVENNIYTIALPAGALPLLADGVAFFSLTLQGPGLQGAPGGCCSTTSGNGAGLDFVRLTTFQDLSEIPEPGTLSLLPAALLVLGAYRRLRT